MGEVTDASGSFSSLPQSCAEWPTQFALDTPLTEAPPVNTIDIQEEFK